MTELQQIRRWTRVEKPCCLVYLLWLKLRLASIIYSNYMVKSYLREYKSDEVGVVSEQKMEKVLETNK